MRPDYLRPSGFATREMNFDRASSGTGCRGSGSLFKGGRKSGHAIIANGKKGPLDTPADLLNMDVPVGLERCSTVMQRSFRPRY